MAERKSVSFDHLLSDWEEKYGASAVPSLMRIASDTKLPDPDRYIALMGSAKLGGEKMTGVISPFLKDPSWMIRSASLKIISAFDQSTDAPKFHAAVFAALQDPALVVRAEAITALEKLKVTGLEEALFTSLEDSSNYYRGTAQYVPQRALQALVRLPIGSKDVAQKRISRLLHLSENEELIRDEAFRKQLSYAQAYFRKAL